MTEYISPPRNPTDPIELQRFFDNACRLLNRTIDGIWGDGSTVKGGQIVEGGTGGLLEAATVTTQAVTDVDETIAIGNGNITDLGDPYPTQHGVCWSKTTLPTIMDNKTEEGAAAATGAFTTAMTGLVALTTYYVRAYATNAYGTVYGAEVEVTMLTAMPSDADLVFYYPLSEVTGSVANDGGANGYDGTLTNFPVDDSQWDGESLVFVRDSDQVGDYIDVNQSLQTQLRATCSFSIVFKMSDGQPASNGYLFGADNLGNDWVDFHVDGNGKLDIRYSAVNAGHFRSNAVFSNGAQSDFQHIVINIVDGTLISCYLNKVLLSDDGTYDGDMTGVDMTQYTSTQDLFIGVIGGVGYGPNNYLYPFDGRIKHFRMYNRALTTAEITALYNNDL